MATVSSGIRLDSNLVNLKAMDVSEVRPEVGELLVPGERMVQAFKTVRDQVIFTDKRLFVVNVQGVTGKKVAYFSYPYAKVQYYGVETAGVLDIDSELVLAFSDGARLQLDFKSRVDIRQISQMISGYIL